MQAGRMVEGQMVEGEMVEGEMVQAEPVLSFAVDIRAGAASQEVSLREISAPSG
jgi:hypothetical protein